jgi:hypothetical protein
MTTREIVRYIYDHAQDKMDLFEETIVNCVSSVVLTERGFRISFREAPVYYVEMWETSNGIILVRVNEPMITFDGRAQDQIRARAVLEEVRKCFAG